ncbi:sialidase family protein [Actinoplanes flavus]|uniref:Exo-alpha-sialidase n=1 Tax=Actinoplanes flavus TaxID=2820290 RepID=A0ABS3UZ91_9ACTN|nr:sialidase family protein [Actinoplanes flavus]MBO3743895.1 exo-alpha-sialidase [Actinoplanes flavus]
MRRRRAVTAAAVFLATVLTATGLVATARDVPDERDLFDTAPTVTEAPDAGWPRTTSAAYTGTEVYAVHTRCRECNAELYVSSDEGDSWQRRTMPPAPENALRPREASLRALAPGVIIWREATFVPFPTAETPAAESPRVMAGPTVVPWITRDGGRSWHRAEISTQPVAVIPDGVSPIECSVWGISTCTVGVVDPATGRFAPLASQPTGITVEDGWTSQINVPLGGRPWIPGLDPVTRKPAVATSADGGRTWHTHVFTDGVAAVYHEVIGVAAMYLPRIAAGPGAAAYVLTHRADHVVDVRYTTDGGETWNTGDTIADGDTTGYVTADGTHILTTTDDRTTTSAGHGTGKYTPVTLPGYPESPSTAQFTGQYLVTAEDGMHLSADGRTWRRISPP